MVILFHSKSDSRQGEVHKSASVKIRRCMIGIGGSLDSMPMLVSVESDVITTKGYDVEPVFSWWIEEQLYVVRRMAVGGFIV